MNISVIVIFNIVCVNADQEYSQVLNEHAGYFQIKARSLASELKVAFVSGESATNYFTLPQGAVQWLSGKISGKKTLYFQSPQAGTVCEIICGY